MKRELSISATSCGFFIFAGPCYISVMCSFWGSPGSFSVFSGVFTVEVGVGDRVSGDTTAVDVQTLFEAFSNKAMRSACVIEAFFW
jgi:hypothetical protein